MQQLPPVCKGNTIAHQSCPDFPQPLKPLLVLWAELSFQLLSYPLGERGTLASRRDGDLQRPAAHDRGKIEVATRGLIDCVAQNSAVIGLPEDELVDCIIRCRGNYDEYVIKIRHVEVAPLPVKRAP